MLFPVFAPVVCMFVFVVWKLHASKHTDHSDRHISSTVHQSTTPILNSNLIRDEFRVCVFVFDENLEIIYEHKHVYYIYNLMYKYSQIMWKHSSSYLALLCIFLHTNNITRWCMCVIFGEIITTNSICKQIDITAHKTQQCCLVCIHSFAQIYQPDSDSHTHTRSEILRNLFGISELCVCITFIEFNALFGGLGECPQFMLYANGVFKSQTCVTVCAYTILTCRRL